MPIRWIFGGFFRVWNPQNGVLPAELPANRVLGGMPRNAAKGPRIAR
jgi:hypothetical protein